MSASIWWIRRDIRIEHNDALNAALELGLPVIPLFILDPVILESSRLCERRNAFLLEGLQNLDRELRDRGSRLIIRQGNPVLEIQRLIAESDARIIFAEPDYSPYALKRDRAVEQVVRVNWVGSPAILPPGTILKSDSKPYTVFTPFSRAWKAKFSYQSTIPTSLDRLIYTPGSISSLSIPEQPIHSISMAFPASALEAKRRVLEFMEGDSPQISNYSSSRDRVDLLGTSMLSPYLHLGMISPQWLAQSAITKLSTETSAGALQSIKTWLNELIWRDFYIQILYHFPRVTKDNFRPTQIAWQNDINQFQSWSDGQTGYPIIDASMRQLQSTGWMHNRARMITASFLTKDLLIDWRWGENFFMQHLIDGDLAANNGGWQWVAGTGTDAMPYFRIFNPISQSIRFDPHGNFIRTYIPELSHLPVEYIHEPWNMPILIQKQLGVEIGKHYPPPIVDHVHARERALDAYRKKVVRANKPADTEYNDIVP